MYQETVKFPEGKTWETVLYIAAIVAGVFVISLLSWLLSSLGLPWVDLLAVAAVAAETVAVAAEKNSALLLSTLPKPTTLPIPLTRAKAITSTIGQPSVHCHLWKPPMKRQSLVSARVTP